MRDCGIRDEREVRWQMDRRTVDMRCGEHCRSVVEQPRFHSHLRLWLSPNSSSRSRRQGNAGQLFLAQTLGNIRPIRAEMYRFESLCDSLAFPISDCGILSAPRRPCTGESPHCKRPVSSFRDQNKNASTACTWIPMCEKSP